MKSRQGHDHLNTRRLAARRRKEMKRIRARKAERGRRNAQKQAKKVVARAKRREARRNPILAQFLNAILGGRHAQ